jgi:hut operon positive regulatory protein
MPSTARAVASNGARSHTAAGRLSDQSAWARGLGYRAMRVLMDVLDGAEIMPVSGPYRAAIGRVGTMDTQDIYSAVLTVAERAKLLDSGLNDAHALYHATHDALLGILRDPAGLGPTLRTTALLYAILRGPRLLELQGERDWIAVAMFGSIGAPRPAWEHDAVGLGIYNL